MDTKEIKSALKSIKENLDQKDFKTAIKQCKSILKVDRNNYLALVFYGAAVQETEQRDQASKAFKKAIEVAPDQLLAWRGLASFYEKNKAESEEKDLLKTYERIIILENEISKLPEIIEKYEELAISVGDSSSLKELFDNAQNADDHKKLLLQQCLTSIFASNSNLLEEMIEVYQNWLKDLISDKPFTNNYLECFKKYLKILYKQKNFKEIIVEANKIIELFPDDIILLEWICKAYTEIPEEILKKDLTDYSPENAYSKLLSLVPDSYLGFFCKGVHKRQLGDLLTACEALKEAVKFKTNLGLLWYKLCLCQVLLYQFFEAEKSVLEAIKYFEKVEKNKEIIFLCEKKLLQSLCEQEDESKLLNAEKLGKKLHESNINDVEVLQCLIKSLIKLKKYFDVDKFLNKLSENKNYIADAKYLNCLNLKHQNKIDECKDNLEKLVDEAPEFEMAWLELGKIYYYENNRKCLSCFLKSTKLNPWCFLNFLFLGHCYKTMVIDLEKARRCYQKAFQLNSTSVEAGVNLSHLYRILGKEELNMQLLSSVATANPRLKWAWLNLGLHYLSVNQQQDAVNSLQMAVRLDPDDKKAWECLGDAYFNKAAYTSALKSYQKVSELDPESIYPALQIANIKHLIGLFTESIEEFRIINDKVPNYIPSLKGLSEACLSLMKYYLSQNLNGLAQDACQEAVFALIKCLQYQKNLICIWKLLGDFCTLLSALPENYCKLKVPSWLFLNVNFQEEQNSVVLDKTQVLKLGARSYCQAIALNVNFPSLWYDLAFIYNRMVEVSKTEESKRQMRLLASSAACKSIFLNKNSWEALNLYAIILASKEIQNYYLAQHCFTKAILKNDTNALTWTNLGTFYLNLDDLPIANQAFAEAQRYDHNYVFCWVGQAIIAQKTGHHDAMDLFRHSTHLGFSSEGYLGYSNLVCRTLLEITDKNNKSYLYSIENMNAITVACNALIWYTDRIPNNSWAYNMLGLLLERQMLYTSSAEAFSRALKLESSKKLITGKDQSNIFDKILLNYSRILSNLKKYDEAILHLKQIKQANFTNQCEMAATFYKAKQYEEAYSCYETILEWLAPDTEVKSHILVAMAAVVYLHQGQEDAKILLMQSCQLKPPSVQGLFALCALGMLHSDLPLSELALKELNNYKDNIRYLGHIAVFQAFIYLFKGQKQKAIRILCEVIHKHPNQPSLWLSLSVLLLHLYPSFDSRSSARCAEVALTCGRSSIDVSKVMSLVSLSNLLSGEGVKSLRSSQKAVHMFPDVTENWVVLVASVLSKCLLRQTTEEIFWLKKMITYIRRKFESSKPMTQWLSNNNRKITIMANEVVS